MDNKIYESMLAPINSLSQPNDSVMRLKEALTVVARLLDQALTRIAILEAVQDAPKSVTPLLNTAEVSEVLRHTIVEGQR
jgi:hypothetical protein